MCRTHSLAARLLGLGALLLAGAPRALADAATPCAGPGDAVAIVTRTHELWLCRGGVVHARFSVALGRGGVDKRRHGDARTPLGSYPLGEPRPSRRFGTFIPIGYPTPEQEARGFTGSAVGIHGPARAGAVPVALDFDWTLGCVATSSDSDVDAIAAFVRARRPRVVIR